MACASQQLLTAFDQELISLMLVSSAAIRRVLPLFGDVVLEYLDVQKIDGCYQVAYIILKCFGTVSNELAVV